MTQSAFETFRNEGVNELITQFVGDKEAEEVLQQFVNNTHTELLNMHETLKQIFELTADPHQVNDIRLLAGKALMCY